MDTKESIEKFIRASETRIQPCTDAVVNEFHNNVNKDLSIISFSGISGAELKKSRSLDELYIPNKFIIPRERNVDFVDGQNYFDIKESKEFKTLFIEELSRLFDINDKIVIIGLAGFGKTTTINYLYYKYGTLFGEDRLRIKINLKDYASILTDNQTILDCLVAEFKKHIQNADKYDVRSKIDEYLSLGKALIIFDALDEIQTEAARHRVRDEISSFSNVYYLNRIIITSREVGYLRNKFDTCFLHLRICPFNSEQNKLYSRLWFDANTIEGSFEQFYSRFQVEAEKSNCEELLKSPIILILALIVFNAERSLPHRRVEFYKKCVDTFLYTREQVKDAFVWSEKGKNLLSDNLTIPKIAHYKYEHSYDKDYRFSYDELENAIYTTLGVSTRISWMDAVKQFAKYLVERTELMQEKDSDVYDFAHKTFGEYFLALYFANNLDNDVLIEQINNWIGDSNNDEMAMLILEVVIANNHTVQHQAIVKHILDKTYALTKEKNMQRARDFISILFRIYSSGMLLAKFEESYYRILLSFPSYVSDHFRFNRSDLNIRNVINFTRYVEYAEALYIESNDIYFLFNQFAHLFKSHEKIDEVEFFSDHVKKVFAIFELLSEIDDKKDHSLSKKHRDVTKLHKLNTLILDYMSYNKNEHIPHIFLILLKITITLPSDFADEQTLNLLSSFPVTQNTFFTLINGPMELFSIIALTFKSPRWFVIVLKAIMISSEAAFIFNYLLDKGAFAYHSDDRRREYVVDNAKRLLKLFVNKSTYEDFQENIPISVFNQQYVEVYQKCYDIYIIKKEEFSQINDMNLILQERN